MLVLIIITSIKVNAGGDLMNQTDEIIKLAEKNHGMVTAHMVADAGYLRGILKYLADRGKLERVSRGVYTLPEAWEDEFVSLQSRYKRGVYSHETALFLCDLTDRTPARMNMTFPGSYNMTSPKKEGILCSCAKEPFYSMGITEFKTPGGNLVRAYCAERTLCDILKTRSQTDVQVITDSFRRYVARKEKDIPLLSEYAKVFHIDKKLRPYLEVLL